MSDYKQLIESIVITLLESGDDDIHEAFKYYCNIMGEKKYIKEDVQTFIRNEYRLLSENVKPEKFDETKKMLELIDYDRKQT